MLLKIRIAMKIIALLPEIYKAVEPTASAANAMRKAANIMNKSADVAEELEKKPDVDEHS